MRRSSIDGRSTSEKLHMASNALELRPDDRDVVHAGDVGVGVVAAKSCPRGLIP